MVDRVDSPRKAQSPRGTQEYQPLELEQVVCRGIEFCNSSALLKTFRLTCVLNGRLTQSKQYAGSAGTWCCSFLCLPWFATSTEPTWHLLEVNCGKTYTFQLQLMELVQVSPSAYSSLTMHALLNMPCHSVQASSSLDMLCSKYQATSYWQKLGPRCGCHACWLSGELQTLPT